MKKLMICLVLALMMTLIGSVALAEGELPTAPFTWEQLATIAGATLATLLIVQLLKLPLDKVWKIPTRIVAYFIALILMIVATYFTIGLTWSDAGLAAINAVIVALAAMGAYELTFRKGDEGKKKAEEVQ
jgi:energy-coupling factor transporter transmembrane protein EcfT